MQLHPVLISLFSPLLILTKTNCEISLQSGRSFDARQRNLFSDGNSRRVNFVNPRQSRFLSLFTLVQFSNQECMGATGDNGTCVTAAECSQRGGTANGLCAGGYGTCCLFLGSCGDTIRENQTYFVPRGYPTLYDGTGSCQVTLLKSNPDVCQYRLDFDQFNIMGPETVNNVCDSDQFIVSGGTPVPPICGNNAGNHMYVDAGAGITNPITLSVVTSGPSFPRNWKIRVTQLLCSSNYRAEEGCLQYFTGVAGQIRSFNYEAITGAQLSNQDYSICVRNERNFCGIQYTPCIGAGPNASQSFTLSGNSNSNILTSLVGPTSCTQDYLIIPMAGNLGVTASPGVPVFYDRFCGGALSATPNRPNSTTVRTTVKPFRLYFHTDSLESPADVANKGFCLNYVQQPCTNNVS